MIYEYKMTKWDDGNDDGPVPPDDSGEWRLVKVWSEKLGFRHFTGIWEKADLEVLKFVGSAVGDRD